MVASLDFSSPKDVGTVVVAKAQLERIGRTSLRTEAQTIEQMRAFFPPALQPTLPRVLRTRRAGLPHNVLLPAFRMWRVAAKLPA